MPNTLTIHEASAALKAKKFSSVELTKACLAQIKKVDSKLNAFTYVAEKESLEMARQADHLIGESLKSGEYIDPLAGVPCGLKDVFCTDGMPTTACSNILKGFAPPYDATCVERLKSAGMVIIGKTNTDEFTCGASTETSCYGVTKNPWDIAGGSAASVSSDECLYALGTDTGGSIRQPAAFCGVTGLKVTYGRVPRFGVISMASSLDTIGPLAKDVEDAALIMNVIAGSDEYDSTQPATEIPEYTKSLLGTDLKGFTIGLPKEYFIEGLDPEVSKAVRESLKVFEKMGAQVKEISLPHTKYACAVYYIICPSEVSSNMARYDGIRYGPDLSGMGLDSDASDVIDYYFKVRDRGFGDEMKRRIMIGTFALSSGYYDAYYSKAQKVRTLIKKDFDDAFLKVDVICCPVTPTPAFRIGEKTSDPVAMYLSDIFTNPINLAGVPSLALPCGFASGKNEPHLANPGSVLPIGMQLIGNQFMEPLLLRFGHAFQQMTDWHKRKPAL